MSNPLESQVCLENGSHDYPVITLASALPPDHVVEDQQEFGHAGDQDHLPRLAGPYQAIVEGPGHRVEARGLQGTHIEHLPNPGPSAQTERRPRKAPLSRFKGATPIREAHCLRFSPDSNAIKGRAGCDPTP